MSTLNEEKEKVLSEDFSDISEDEKRRMIRISNLIAGEDYPMLKMQVLTEAMKAVEMISKGKLSSDDTRTGVALIMATVCNAIHFLLENDILEYVEK